MMAAAWKNGELSPGLHNPLKFHLLNPQLAQQGLLNPLQQQTIPAGASTSAANVQTLLTSNYPATATGMGVNPFIFPQTIYTPSTTSTATTAPSMFYGTSPFLTPYTFVNPYTTALQLGQQPTAYYIPQTGLGNQQNLFYFIPTTAATAAAASTNTQSQPSPSSTTAPETTETTPTSSLATPPTVQQQLPQLSSLIAPNPRLLQPPRNSTSSTSSSDSESRTPDRYEHHPVSPNSRKRHQSVPEKLTTLLQVPASTYRSNSPSIEEDNVDSPPSVKKQRSTSDTTVYYTPYGFTQLSPHRGHSPQRNSTSPQPPEQQQSQPQGLSPFQTHLLQVHSIPPAERRRKQGHTHSHRSGLSPRKDHSPQNRVQEMDEKEAEDIVGGALQSSGQPKELPGKCTYQFILCCYHNSMKCLRHKVSKIRYLNFFTNSSYCSVTIKCYRHSWHLRHLY